MEASALQAPAALTRSRLSIGAPLLRLRSDEQLVALFRGGNEEAFRIIHERYHQRLFAYARQMLPGPRQDAEDALQDIFVRAYSGLRSSNRQLALRAWLYRVAHNRCVDELRRPAPPSPELMEIVRPPAHDPIAEAERRDSLRRLVEDVRRLPEHQRSALLMRELGGMAYADLAAALGVSVPAVKSLLVRARIGLAHSMQARDTACDEIRAELSTAYDRGVRPSGLAKRHMHDCVGCRNFRRQIRGTSRQLAALVPVGPLAAIANLFGFGGGAAGGGGGAAAAGGVAGTTGAAASIGAVAGGAATHVATILAAAVVTAGGAVEIQGSASLTPHHVAPRAAAGAAAESGSPSPSGSGATGGSDASSPASQSVPASPRGLSQSQANAAGAPAAATAGPAIPTVDELNPAASANSANSSTGTGSAAAGATSPGAPPSGTPAGSGEGASNPSPGTGSGEGTYSGMGTGFAGTGSSSAGTAAGGTGSTDNNAAGSSGAPDGTSSAANGTSGITDGAGGQAHGPNVPAGYLAAPAAASGGATAVPALASRTVGVRSRLIGRRSRRGARHG